MRSTDVSGTGSERGAGSGLRILVINWQDRQNPLSGGAETHLHETFGRLAAQGHDVVLLCSGWPGAPPRVELDGIEVHRVGGRYTFLLHAARYARRHLEPVDVVVEDLNKVPLFAPLWASAPVVLLVHHLFGTTAFREANLAVASATWLLERPVPLVFRGTRTIAVSGSTREDLVARGMHPDRITVIPNGVDLDAFGDEPPAPGERFPEPTILYIGRLKRYKRVDLVLRAVARLRDRGMDVRLRIAGKGDHREALEALRDRLGLEDRVRFEGFVPRERKVELLRRSWVHVLTSPKEGWGIANLEAAAAGTPTVASDAPGLRESVVDGETGYLVPHGDVDALVRRLREVLDDPELRDALGREARSFAAGFSWDATARRVLGVLTAEAGRGAATAPGPSER